MPPGSPTSPTESWELHAAAIHDYAAFETLSSAALRPIVQSIPREWNVRVRVRANPRFVANTLNHERRHAAHIRQACTSAFLQWNTAVLGLVGQWFGSELEMDNALFHAAGLSGYSGSRTERLAQRIALPVGLQAQVLHEVDEHNQFQISSPRWRSSERTLEFTFVETARTVTQRPQLGRSRLA